MFLHAVLFLVAFAIVLFAVVWAWRNGTLRTSEQERFDMKFERIVRRLDAPSH